MAAAARARLALQFDPRVQQCTNRGRSLRDLMRASAARRGSVVAAASISRSRWVKSDSSDVGVCPNNWTKFDMAYDYK
jgi:hypothetical protein